MRKRNGLLHTQHLMILPVFGEAANGEVEDVRRLTEGQRARFPSTPAPAVPRSLSPFGFAKRGGSGWRDTVTGGVFKTALHRSVIARPVATASRPVRRANLRMAEISGFSRIPTIVLR